MSAIAKAILANAKPTLLNWDHEVYPTPVEDFLLNVQERVHGYAGWSHMNATFLNNVLIVECGTSPTDVKYTLRYDAVNRREYSGRLGHLGLASLIEEIHSMVRH